jgi:hypothetical protein
MSSSFIAPSRFPERETSMKHPRQFEDVMFALTDEPTAVGSTSKGEALAEPSVNRPAATIPINLRIGSDPSIGGLNESA